MADELRRQGLFYALVGFLLFTVGDGVIKSIDGAWPAPAVAALRFAFATLFLGALLLHQGGRSAFRFPKPGAQILRGFGIAVGSGTFFASLFLMSMATAVSIQFISPQITALLSAIFLGERIGRSTILASMLAFAGVLIVLRPDFAELGWAAFLPVVTAFSFSALVIGNRIVAGTGPLLLQQFLVAAIAATILSVAAFLGHVSGLSALSVGPPEPSIIARCALVAVIATVGHSIVFMATTRASAATIAPMSYVQLLGATVIGILFYDDVPDRWALVGSAMIIGAGLWLWMSKPHGKDEEVLRSEATEGRP